MTNICELFIKRSFSLLRTGGVFVEIFPLAFACDWSYGSLRSFIVNSHTITNVEAFPERDDSRRRVFASAKMSVCILVARKGRSQSDGALRIRIHDSPFVDAGKPTASVRPSEIAQIDANYVFRPISASCIALPRSVRALSLFISASSNRRSGAQSAGNFIPSWC